MSKHTITFDFKAARLRNNPNDVQAGDIVILDNTHVVKLSYFTSGMQMFSWIHSDSLSWHQVETKRLKPYEPEKSDLKTLH